MGNILQRAVVLKMLIAETKNERTHCSRLQKHIMRTTNNATQRATNPLINGWEHHESSTYPLFNVTHTPATPILVIELNQTSTNMEVDTGSSVSLISKDTYDKLWLNSAAALPLKQSSILLRTYTGEHLEVVSSASVDVCYKEQITHFPLIVVASSDPSLLGWD